MSWSVWGSPEASWGYPRMSWVRLGCVASLVALGRSRGLLKASCRRLESALGASWRRLEGVLGRLGNVLGRLGGVLKAPICHS